MSDGVVDFTTEDHCQGNFSKLLLTDNCVSPVLDNTLFKLMDNSNRDIYPNFSGNELRIDQVEISNIFHNMNSMINITNNGARI